MLEVKNLSEFTSVLVPIWNISGREAVLIIVKCTFEYDDRGKIWPAEEQANVVFADEFIGEPGKSSVRWDADIALQKNAVDVIINGTAHAPAGRPTSQCTVGVRLGNIKRVLQVSGDRKWKRTFSGLSATLPKPFLRMPIIYERAFGGIDESSSSNAKHSWHPDNPVGRGYALSMSSADGQALPNIEWPDSILRHWSDKPELAGLSFVCRNWQPRSKFSGTYDDKWIKREMPYLPKDFDLKYFQSANPRMIFPRIPEGLRVDLLNLSEDGHASFSLPHLRLQAIFNHFISRGETSLRMDTLVFEPDLGRFVMIFRGEIPCFGDPLKLREVIVGELTPGQRRAALTGKKYVLKGRTL